jgi:hypothetical protein
MLDKFVTDLGCEDVSDLGWLDSWARSFQVVSKKTLRYRAASAMPIACDILDNAPQCPIACDSVVPMPKSAKMPTWFMVGMDNNDVYSDSEDDYQQKVEGLNPAVELRYNLFGKMLANFHENGGKFLQAEDFDKCFKGE